MRTGILLLAFSTLITSCLYWLINMYPGFILISVGDLIIQFTLWTAALSIVVIWLLLRGLTSLIRTVFLSSLLFSTNRDAKRQRKNNILTYRGLIDLAEGKWASAIKRLSKSAPYSELPLLNYLGVANASAELGNENDVQLFLNLAEKKDSRNQMAVQLTRARLHIEKGRYAEALPDLKILHTRYPDNPLILKLLTESYLTLKKWDALEKLLPELRNKKVMADNELVNLEATFRTEQLLALPKKQNENSTSSECKSELDALWARSTKKVRATPSAIASYVKALYALNEKAAAEKELRKAIKSSPDKHLILLYGQIEGVDSGRQLSTAESWLKTQADNPDLLLTLARLCKRNELWGKARDYLEAALKIERRPEIYAELANVLEHLGESVKGQQAYRQGLLEMVERTA